jgi:hypothetical protein
MISEFDIFTFGHVLRLCFLFIASDGKACYFYTIFSMHIYIEHDIYRNTYVVQTFKFKRNKMQYHTIDWVQT